MPPKILFQFDMYSIFQYFSIKNNFANEKMKTKRSTSDELMYTRTNGDNRSILHKATNIEEYEEILISDKARKSFFAASKNPPNPNQALRKSVIKHNETIDKY